MYYLQKINVVSKDFLHWIEYLVIKLAHLLYNTQQCVLYQEDF